MGRIEMPDVVNVGNAVAVECVGRCGGFDYSLFLSTPTLISVAMASLLFFAFWIYVKIVV
jgi:hypothetical protein